MERWAEVPDGKGQCVKHGEYSAWHENGNLMFTGRYERGRKHGRWCSFDEEGNLRLEATFRDGKREGLWVLYDEAGRVERAEQYSDTVLDSIADRNMSPPVGRSLLVPVGGAMEAGRQVESISLEDAGDGEAEAEEGLVDLLEIDTIPVPRKRVEPVYPGAALETGKEGRVTVNVMINEEGAVQRIGRITGPRVFHDAARKAAQQWTFSPAAKDGKPVKVWISLPLNFWLIKEE